MGKRKKENRNEAGEQSSANATQSNDKKNKKQNKNACLNTCPTHKSMPGVKYATVPPLLPAYGEMKVSCSRMVRH